MTDNIETYHKDVEVPNLRVYAIWIIDDYMSGKIIIELFVGFCPHLEVADA